MQKGEEQKLKLTAEAIKNLGSVQDFKFHRMSGEEVLSHFRSN